MKIRSAPSGLVALLAVLVGEARGKERPAYPQPDRSGHTDTYHGQVVADPYRWMEAPQDPRLLDWLATERNLLDNYLGDEPERKRLGDRVLQLSQGVRYSVPIKARGRLFFMETAPSGRGGLSLVVREPGQATNRILFGAMERFGPDALLQQIAPSPDGRYVAYTLSKRRSRYLGLQVFDTQSSSDLPDVLTGPHSISGGISWTLDSQAFYYDAFEPPNPGDGPGARVHGAAVWRHTLGQPQSQDTLVAALPNDPTAVLSHRVTEDGRYLVVTALIDGTRNQVMYRDLQSPVSSLRTLIGTKDATYTFLGNAGRRFWFYTDKAAPHGRVIAIDVDRPEPDHWSEVIAERPEAINAHDQTGGNALGMYGERFVMMYVQQGRPLVRIFSNAGRLQREITLPIGGSIWGGFAGSQDDHEVFYQYLGLTDPSTIFRLDLRTGATALFQETPVPFDRSSISVRQVFYGAPDGARIPMFVVHKKDVRVDGRAPVYLYGYGAMGWLSFTWFQPHVLAWLEMGGIYAQPALPGEGGFGREWRRAGVKAGKENVLAHYIAAAEWLVANNYARKGRIVASGGSLSGPLAAIAIERRPQLFAAATIAIPVLDLLRFDQFTGGAFWTPEFGSPQDPADWKALRALSPYHNLVAGRCAPPTLVLAGELDQTAPPLHSYKYVAAAQAAQSCANPVLLKVMSGAGHDYGRTPEQVADSYGDELSFLVKATGVGRPEVVSR